MNSSGFNIAICLLLFSFFFMGLIKAQPTSYTYSEVALPEIFKSVEQYYGVSINFDVEGLKGYTFSGEVPLGELEETLASLLDSNPFEYQISDKIVLIYLGEKKLYRICGTLIDHFTKEPLAFASVVLDGTNLGANTDKEGNFEFQIRAFEYQFIKFRYLGYASHTVSIERWKGNECLTFSLLPEATFFDPIIIQDYVLPGIKEGTAYGSLEINFLRLSRNYTGQEHDVLKTAQILPGITSVDETSANLSIRGSTPDQNLILWEGATLYDPGHIFGMISSISPFVVDKVKIYKGVFAPHYDNRVGGIVDISLTDKISSRMRAGIGATFTEAHAFLDVPIIKDKLSLLLSGRNTLSNLFDSPTLGSYSQRVFQATKVEDGQAAEDEEEDVTIDQSLNFYDVNGKILFQPIEKLLLKAAFFRSKNDFFYDFQVADASFQTSDQVVYSMETFSAEAQYAWNTQHQSSISWVQSSYENTYGFSLSEPLDSVFNIRSNTTNTIRDQKLRFNHRWMLNSQVHLEAGYVLDQKSAAFLFEEDSEFEENVEDLIETQGDYQDLYTSLTYDGEKVLLNAGLKATYFEQAEALLFSPRASIQVSLNSHLKVKASSGQLYQFISQLQDISQDELIGIANIWVLTDSEDELLRARKFSAGWLFRKNGWLLDMDAYYHTTQGLASFSTRIGSGIEIDGNGKSRTRGIDLLAKKRWEKWQLGLNYTWNDNTFTFPEINSEAFPASNDIRHNLGFTQSFTLNQWEFSSTYQFRSGLPFSSPTAVSPWVNEEGELNYELTYDKLNDRRLLPYHRLDMGIVYRKNFEKNPLKLEASLSVINLLDRENVFSRETLLGENEETELPEPFILEKRLLGITPLVMVRLYWE